MKSITKSGGRFDPDRCKWFNQQYLQNADSSIVATVLEKEVKSKGFEDSAVDINRVAQLIQNRLTLLTDVWNEASFFFVEPLNYDEKAVRKQWKDETADILTTVIGLLGGSKETSANALRSLIKGYADDNGIGLGKIMAPLRIALVGGLRGPAVFEICSTIGVNKSILRINNALKHISG